MNVKLAELLHGAGLGDIVIPKKDFIKEHKHLVSLLNRYDIPAFKQEAADQSAELKRMTGGFGKSSGFIRRMMAENALKHKGSYGNPTSPLHPKSTMKSAVAFDIKKLANRGQKGTSTSDYGASPFILSHFGLARGVKPYERRYASAPPTEPYARKNKPARAPKESEAQREARKEFKPSVEEEPSSKFYFDEEDGRLRKGVPTVISNAKKPKKKRPTKEAKASYEYIDPDTITVDETQAKYVTRGEKMWSPEQLERIKRYTSESALKEYKKLLPAGSSVIPHIVSLITGSPNKMDKDWIPPMASDIVKYYIQTKMGLKGKGVSSSRATETPQEQLLRDVMEIMTFRDTYPEAIDAMRERNYGNDQVVAVLGDSTSIPYERVKAALEYIEAVADTDDDEDDEDDDDDDDDEPEAPVNIKSDGKDRDISLDKLIKNPDGSYYYGERQDAPLNFLQKRLTLSALPLPSEDEDEDEDEETGKGRIKGGSVNVERPATPPSPPPSPPPIPPPPIEPPGFVWTDELYEFAVDSIRDIQANIRTLEDVEDILNLMLLAYEPPITDNEYQYIIDYISYYSQLPPMGGRRIKGKGGVQSSLRTAKRVADDLEHKSYISILMKTIQLNPDIAEQLRDNRFSHSEDVSILSDYSGLSKSDIRKTLNRFNIEERERERSEAMVENPMRTVVPTGTGTGRMRGRRMKGGSYEDPDEFIGSDEMRNNMLITLRAARRGPHRWTTDRIRRFIQHWDQYSEEEVEHILQYVISQLDRDARA